MVERCYTKLFPKWRTRLAGADAYLKDNCWAMLESLAVQFPETKAAGRDAKDEAIRKDLKALTGTWGTLTFVNDGKKIGKDEAKTHTATYSADRKYQAYQGDKLVFEGTLKIDPTKKPKTIDVTERSKVEGKPKVFLGIYELDGDKLKVCFAPPGKERPTEFSSEPGSGRFVSVRQRQRKSE